MARDMKDVNDLVEVQIPASAGKSREWDAGHSNDTKAQHNAAVQLAYFTHGSNCKQCGDAQTENQLCRIGMQLYGNMRNAGLVD
jgi:hypothetical protein